jgi:hypothetical protein
MRRHRVVEALAPDDGGVDAQFGRSRAVNFFAKGGIMASSNSSTRKPLVRLGMGNAPAKLIKHVGKVHMGMGDAPPRIVKHVSQDAPADAPSPSPVKHEPQVRMGTGDAPPRVVKHVPQVRTGTGDAPPRVVKHLPRVRMGDGAAPPAILKHLR